MSTCGCNSTQHPQHPGHSGAMGGCPPSPVARCLTCPVLVSLTRPPMEVGQTWFNPSTGIALTQQADGRLSGPQSLTGSGLRVNTFGALEVVIGKGLSINLGSNAMEVLLGAGFKTDYQGAIIFDTANATAMKALGEAIAAQVPPDAGAVVNAITEDSAAIAQLAAELADDLGATAAQTIAGTEAAKFVSPDDMSAALQDGANYKIVTSINSLENVAFGANHKIADITAQTVASRAIQGELVAGAASGDAGVFSAGVTGDVGGGVISSATTLLKGVKGVVGNNAATGAGHKQGVFGQATGAGGTNIGVFGTASNGGANWAGWLEGDVRITGMVYSSTEGAFPGAGNTSTGWFIESAGTIMGSRDNSAALIGNRNSDGTVAGFHRSGVQVGAINVTATDTAYTTLSDYRLKTVDGPVKNPGKFIDALKPVTGEWKAEPGKKANFFLAHEVQEVSPSSVSGEKDAVDAEGKPMMQSMEYGSADFIVNIIAELQDLRKRVKALEAK